MTRRVQGKREREREIDVYGTAVKSEKKTNVEVVGLC